MEINPPGLPEYITPKFFVSARSFPAAAKSFLQIFAQPLGCRIATHKSFITTYLTNHPVSFYMSDKQKKKPCDMKPCEHLNDRAVEEGVINAKCNCPDNESCPKVRSTKRAVTRQCWRMRKPAQPVPA